MLAERFATAGRRVVVIERRPHIGGNAYDHPEEHGLLIHEYGPHIFHTNNPAVFAYLSDFTRWRPYEHRVLASVRGQLVPLPINARTIELLYGQPMTPEKMEAFLAAQRVQLPGPPRNSEEMVLATAGRELYELFFRDYTAKQWGRPPSALAPSVTARIPIRTNFDDRYFTDTYQAIPTPGYSEMFARMLSHPGIEVLLNTEWEEAAGRLRFRRLIYTGPIDQYFQRRHGSLPYRSLDFRWEVRPVEQVQPVATINYPTDQEFTRVTEYKHLTGQVHPATVLSWEYPQAEGEPYYPVPTEESQATLQRYTRDAAQLQTVRFTGRLGSYRYYNMDQVVAESLQLFAELRQAGW